MNYTDQEILDLETSLDGVGHAKQVVLVLIEPDGWDQKVLGRFSHFMAMGIQRSRGKVGLRPRRAGMLKRSKGSIICGSGVIVWVCTASFSFNS